jgi:hypothetical protein
MTTYVLVGGAWLGGWCWQKVARQLRDDGYVSYKIQTEPTCVSALGSPGDARHY